MIHQNVCRRGVQAPIPHKLVENRSANRAILRPRAGSRPEFFEAFARLGGAAARHPVSERDCIHGAGAGAADRLDVKPLVLEQLVEDAPGKGAMRATALQGEFDRLLGRLIHPIHPNLILLSVRYLESARRPSLTPPETRAHGTRGFLPVSGFLLFDAL